MTRLALPLVILGTALLSAQQATPPALVTTQEIAEGLPRDGARWITFGGSYTNQRHSPLTQITPANVKGLVPQWTFQTATLGNFEATPLLRDNILYVTGPQNVAWALDASSPPASGVPASIRSENRSCFPSRASATARHASSGLRPALARSSSASPACG